MLRRMGTLERRHVRRHTCGVFEFRLQSSVGSDFGKRSYHVSGQHHSHARASGSVDRRTGIGKNGHDEIVHEIGQT